MARKPKSRTSGIDLEPIFGLLSQLGFGGSMSSPANAPQAMARDASRKAVQGTTQGAMNTINTISEFASPGYSLNELAAIRQRGLQPSDAALAALYAVPFTKPLKRTRGAFRAGRAALKGVKTPNTGSRQTAGMAQEPSGELEYAGLTALLRLLEK